MERQWSFLNNPMDEATKDSFRLALGISRIHLEAIRANNSDPAVAGLEATYTVVDTGYRGKYNDWKNQERFFVPRP